MSLRTMVVSPWLTDIWEWRIGDLNPLTSCMPCKRKNRRNSVISNESRQLSHPILPRVGDIIHGW